MSRLAPLYKVESFRGSVADLFKLSDQDLAELRQGVVGELSDGTNQPMRSELELSRRAFALLYEAAARDGIEDVEGELAAAFGDVSNDDKRRLVAALTPSDDDAMRINGIDARDGFLPILVQHRLALDLRVTEGLQGEQIATPFVTVRFEFDSSVMPGVGAVVFQLNLADIDALVEDLTLVRDRAAKLVAASGNMTIPEWGHGLSD